MTPKFSPKSSDSLSVISYLREVVGDAVAAGAGRRDVDLLAVVLDRQAEDVAAAQGAAGGADEQVALVVLAELTWSERKSMPPGATSYFQVISGSENSEPGSLNRRL